MVFYFKFKLTKQMKMKKTNLNINFEQPKKAQHYITGLIKHLVDEFDQQGTAQNLAKQHYNDSTSKYYHMSVDEILNKWETTRQRSIFVGSALDDYVGLITDAENQSTTLAEWSKTVNFTNDEGIYKRTNAWDVFWKKLEDAGWTMIGREIPLFYTINGCLIGGRTDMIVHNEKLNNITIIDWKTTDEISKSKYTKRMHGPIDRLYQDKGTSYGIQVAFYKMALQDILPDDLKDTTIDTCIVQVRSIGDVVCTKNNIDLTNDELKMLLSWCIEQEHSDNKTFEQELNSLLRKHGLENKFNVDELTKHIIGCMNSTKIEEHK